MDAYVPLSSHLTSETILSSHLISKKLLKPVQLSRSLPVRVLKSTVSVLLRLPDSPVTFDLAQFRLRVWGQGAPRGLRARSQGWAGGLLCGTKVVYNPKGPHRAIHPCFKGLAHQLSVALGRLHGRLLGGKLQHGVQLLKVVIQVNVSRRP